MIKNLLSLLLVFGCISSTMAAFTPETIQQNALPDHRGKAWFWVSGPGVPFSSESRAYLFDAEGSNLGQLNTGTWLNNLLLDESRDEILTIETYFSRGTRGERSDQVVIYDPHTLQATAEIPIPAKRMHAVKSTGVAVFSDDHRFLLIANFTPAQSITVVDLEKRSFVTEIDTPGCSVLYPAGDRDFYSICGNGGFMQIRLDNQGLPTLLKRHPPLFDPAGDFLTTAASRIGDTWYFVSYENNARAITMTPDYIGIAKQWSLLTEAERSDNWRISGQHHTATHVGSKRLFVLMHQGDEHTFEEPGDEVWIFDTESGERLDTIVLDDVALSIAVSQDQDATFHALAFHFPLPTLFTMWIYLVEGEAQLLKHAVQVVDTYDTKTGEHLNKVGDIPPSYMTVVEPW
jgi:methylamine dehydrogenase heavy chain